MPSIASSCRVCSSMTSTSLQPPLALGTYKILSGVAASGNCCSPFRYRASLQPAALARPSMLRHSDRTLYKAPLYLRRAIHYFLHPPAQSFPLCPRVVALSLPAPPLAADRASTAPLLFPRCLTTLPPSRSVTPTLASTASALWHRLQPILAPCSPCAAACF